ncbi:AfsR/SARP family transcriptional regulator [Amycolatopsis sp. cmx-4-61]|uniref:AfsR/SARP family transcriptional regulator n=1 Tax=Amycolatopsis sp. cmx-4-61 TaxID=2790937 RepID=UPI00397AC9B6
MTAEFCLLGNIEARIDGRVIDLGPLRQRSVLAILLVEANQIYSYLHRLRRALASVAGADIIRESGGYLVSIDEAVVDLHRFREPVRHAGRWNIAWLANMEIAFEQRRAGEVEREGPHEAG